jgi:hypothetical protein
LEAHKARSKSRFNLGFKVSRGIRGKRGHSQYPKGPGSITSERLKRRRNSLQHSRFKILVSPEYESGLIDLVLTRLCHVPWFHGYATKWVGKVESLTWLNHVARKLFISTTRRLSGTASIADHSLLALGMANIPFFEVETELSRSTSVIGPREDYPLRPLLDFDLPQRLSHLVDQGLYGFSLDRRRYVGAVLTVYAPRRCRVSHKGSGRPKRICISEIADQLLTQGSEALLGLLVRSSFGPQFMRQNSTASSRGASRRSPDERTVIITGVTEIYQSYTIDLLVRGLRRR